MNITKRHNLKMKFQITFNFGSMFYWELINKFW